MRVAVSDEWLVVVVNQVEQMQKIDEWLEEGVVFISQPREHVFLIDAYEIFNGSFFIFFEFSGFFEITRQARVLHDKDNFGCGYIRFVIVEAEGVEGIFFAVGFADYFS